MDNKPINFTNFQPSPGFEALANTLYQEVCFRAPSSSSVTFRFEKQGDVYSAYGTIDSHRGVYVGYSAQRDPSSSLREMGRQLENRLTLVYRRDFDNYLRKTG